MGSKRILRAETAGYNFGAYVDGSVVHRGFNNNMCEIYHFNTRLSGADVAKLRNNCNAYYSL